MAVLLSYKVAVLLFLKWYFTVLYVIVLQFCKKIILVYIVVLLHFYKVVVLLFYKVVVLQFYKW